MLSLDECKRILNHPDLPEKNLEQIRGSLYYFVEKHMDELFDDKISTNEKNKG